MDQIGRKQISATSGNIEQHINAGSANSMRLWEGGGKALADIPTLNPPRIPQDEGYLLKNAKHIYTQKEWAGN